VAVFFLLDFRHPLTDKEKHMGHLLETYMKATKETPKEESGPQLSRIDSLVIVDQSYNLEGINMRRYKGTDDVLLVHPDSLDQYVRQNIDREMEKAYNFTLRFLQEPDITKDDALECLQYMRDYYNKYGQQGLNDQQIETLKKMAEEWEKKTT